MTRAYSILIICIAGSFLCCTSKFEIPAPSDKTPLIAKDLTNENEKNNSLFVFVGLKISVDSMPYTRGDFDNKFKAKYKVLQWVYGEYPIDTVEFEVYDHYGIPSFSEYTTVMLFLSQHEGKFYHEKYMYNAVYRTKDGRWAGPYTNDYNHSYNKNTTVKPVKVEFEQEVTENFRDWLTETDIQYFYPEPYFRRQGRKAIVVYGNYVEELFRLKKEGVLTARGLFGNRIND